MKLEMMLLFPAVFYLFLIQDFFHGAKAAFNSGVLILNSGDVLEINTTAPSIVNKSCASCVLNASLQIRSSSHGDHLVTSITFSGDIEFRSSSTVKVFGKYALSLRSQNGNILIQTDINMTCGEEVLDTTCLGGFTQSSSPQLVGIRLDKKLFKGLGPGGLTITTDRFPLMQKCVVGSSHGGRAGSGTELVSGQPYDKKNLTSLLGGSGGGMAEECKRYHNRLAELLAIKKGENYSSTVSWIRAKVSFALLRSALLCLRGSRGRRRNMNIQDTDILIENVTARIFLSRFLSFS